MTLDERLSEAQRLLRDGRNDYLSAAVAEARDLLNAPTPLPALTADLLAALREYGQHTLACIRAAVGSKMSGGDQNPRCTCGLLAVIARADALSAHQTVTKEEEKTQARVDVTGVSIDSPTASTGVPDPDGHIAQLRKLYTVDEDAWRRGKVEWS